MIATRKVFLLSLLPLAAVMSVLGLWYVEAHAKAVKPGTEREHALVDETYYLLQQYFDGELTREQLVEGSMSGAALATEDKYTRIFAPQEARRHAERTEGKFYGIGVVIDSLPDGTMQIRGVNAGGPAERAGLKMKDIIIAIDGAEIATMKHEAKVDRIRGDKGQPVKLTILRTDVRMDITVIRDEVVDPTVEGARMLAAPGVGYLRIDTFTVRTATQFDAAIAMLLDKGMRKLVLDLRNNPGGILEEAVAVADRFIVEDGKVITSVRAQSEAKLQRMLNEGAARNDPSIGRVYASSDGGATLKGIPTVALINSESASASEILAGCLQDHDLAYLIGVRTYGKGLVQQAYKLKSDPRYVLKITVARYYTPLGKILYRGKTEEASGLDPDLDIPMDRTQYAQMFQRFQLQRNALPDKPDDLATDADRTAWNAPDPHIEAALAYFEGKPASIPLE